MLPQGVSTAVRVRPKDRSRPTVFPRKREYNNTRHLHALHHWMRIENDYEKPEVADRYEEVRYSAVGGEYVDRTEKAILRTLMNETPGTVLEIGSGTGRITSILLEYVESVVCVDKAEAMLSRAPVDSARVLGDAYELPFPDSSFDLVVAVRMVYLLDDQRGFFEEVSRVLRDGGSFVFTANNRYSSRGLLSLAEIAITGESVVTNNSFDELQTVLTECGLDVREATHEFALPLNSYSRLGEPLGNAAKLVDTIVPEWAKVAMFIKSRKRVPSSER